MTLMALIPFEKRHTAFLDISMRGIFGMFRAKGWGQEPRESTARANDIVQ